MDEKYRYEKKITDVGSDKIVMNDVQGIPSKAKLNGSTNINSHKVKTAIQQLRMGFGEIDIALSFYRQMSKT